MVAFMIGMRVAHKKTGHTGRALQVNDTGRMYILWEEAHWGTGLLYGEWRWCGIFRHAPALVPPPSRPPPLPGPAAILDGANPLNEPN